MFQLLGYDTVILHSAFVPILERGGHGWPSKLRLSDAYSVQGVGQLGQFDRGHKWRVQWDVEGFWCGVRSNANFCSASLQEKNRLSWNVILKFYYDIVFLTLIFGYKLRVLIKRSESVSSVGILGTYLTTEQRAQKPEGNLEQSWHQFASKESAELFSDSD